jgi:hypothetical protein
MSRHATAPRAAAAVALVGVAAVVFWLVSSSPDEPAASELVAPSGDGALFGVHPDGAEDTLADLSDRLGRTPAVVGAFAAFPFEPDDVDNVERSADEALDHGSALLLTLEPHDGLDAVGASDLEELTDRLTSWNERGLPVIVRYAHEMNGDWYPWGQQPDAYVAAFREVAAAVRAAPASETMWAPNEGTGYPFGAADGEAPGDPYAPYYPGDDHVDWVGLTLYHLGSAPPWGDHHVPDRGQFLDRVRGAADAPGVEPATVPDFHAEYVLERGKPFAIAETSALYVPGRDEGPSEVDIKTAWASQLFDDGVPDELPGLDLIVWFEHEKAEEGLDDLRVDWRVTHDEPLRDAFVETLPDWLEFADAPEGSADS